MRVGVVLFPGSNCDHDVLQAYGILRSQAYLIWHKETDLKRPDLVVIPGGFAFGDYLRTGAMAKLSPVMAEVIKFAEKGGPVLGICNGFQILCEVGLLPGILLQNIQNRFLSRFVSIKVENVATPFTSGLEKNKIITCPVAHFEGNYFAQSDTIEELEQSGQVVFRYCSLAGEVSHSSLSINPNGSVNSIAGICNKRGNVVGLMPHPERACEEIVGGVGGESGRAIFEASLYR